MDFIATVLDPVFIYISSSNKVFFKNHSSPNDDTDRDSFKMSVLNITVSHLSVFGPCILTMLLLTLTGMLLLIVAPLSIHPYDALAYPNWNITFACRPLILPQPTSLYFSSNRIHLCRLAIFHFFANSLT